MRLDQGTMRGLLALYACHIALGQTIPTCYNSAGSVAPWFPCNLSEAITPCCNNVDFCMSNGICLNGGADNSFTIQGCTDPDWRSPCNRVCTGPADSSGFVHLWPCEGIQYCCGQNASCCSDSKATTYTIPAATALSHPEGGAVVLNSPTTTTTPTSTPVSSTPANSPATSSTQANSSTPQSSPSNATALAMEVGLGVGIPLGLALVASLAVLGWQIRKLKRSRFGDASDVSAANYGEIHEISSSSPGRASARKNVAELPVSRSWGGH